jgi:hypothetical protein
MAIVQRVLCSNVGSEMKYMMWAVICGVHLRWLLYSLSLIRQYYPESKTKKWCPAFVCSQEKYYEDKSETPPAIESKKGGRAGQYKCWSMCTKPPSSYSSFTLLTELDGDNRSMTWPWLFWHLCVRCPTQVALSSATQREIHTRHSCVNDTAISKLYWVFK